MVNFNCDSTQLDSPGRQCQRGTAYSGVAVACLWGTVFSYLMSEEQGGCYHYFIAISLWRYAFVSQFFTKTHFFID